ncbi:SDR family NAD(P)-dependent oxidoreductase [Thermodesulfobacteriota bacterium]
MGLLDGKIACVTGAGRGVGRAHALALAKEGAKVVVNDLGGTVNGVGTDNMVADDVVKEIVDAGGAAVANYSDAATVEGADSIVWTALSKFGKLDIMVNNAGILRDKTLLNMSEEDWDLVMKVHAKHTFLCTRAAARIMKTQGTGGVIINTSSVSGLAGNFGQSNYGLAKCGIYAFSKITAMELSRYGIRVNCISPSGVTRMTPNAAERGKTSEVSSVEPAAQTVLFLVSDLAKDLTGRVFGATGGVNGSRVAEYKMTITEGYSHSDGIFSARDIADNIDKILNPESDLVMQAQLVKS